MIKVRLFEADLVVALRTVFAQFAAVDVLFLVASKTGRRRFSVLFAGDMAIGACNGLVSSL